MFAILNEKIVIFSLNSIVVLSMHRTQITDSPKKTEWRTVHKTDEHLF